jgi:hypothetical protein
MTRAAPIGWGNQPTHPSQKRIAVIGTQPAQLAQDRTSRQRVQERRQPAYR